MYILFTAGSLLDLFLSVSCPHLIVLHQQKRRCCLLLDLFLSVSCPRLSFTSRSADVVRMYCLLLDLFLSVSLPHLIVLHQQMWYVYCLLLDLCWISFSLSPVPV